MALFRPFRALGFVTEDTPFAVQRRGRETFVALSVGRAWQIYSCEKLTLVLVGPQLQNAITALAMRGDLTFSAIGNEIVVCKRGRTIANLKPQNVAGTYIHLLCVGGSLLALRASGDMGSLHVWTEETWNNGPEACLELKDGFVPTCMAHPDTYLNKVLIGGTDGRLQLWNFVSASLVYEFAGWGSPIRCIEPSPVLDVMGVGLGDGRVVIHNLRTDDEVAQFDNASGLGTGRRASGVLPAARGSTISAIAFRDPTCGPPIMAAAGASGAITFWDLQERRLHAVTHDAHSSRVCSLYFFPGEPRLMSNGADNSVKQWLLEGAEGSPRLLRFRAGHAATPTMIRHYGNGTAILSAGSDLAFRMFSCIQDQQSRELSQGNVDRRAKKLKLRSEDLKLPRVTAMDACQVRERDWANVVTAHDGDCSAYTWILKDAAIGEHVLTPPEEAGIDGEQSRAIISAVAISCCGNFALLGTAVGNLHRFNLQSGFHRGTYRRADAAAAHSGSIAGISSDSRNSLSISSGYDGWLRTWHFKTRQMCGEVNVGHSVMQMAFHPASSLAAVTCDDLSINMYDVEALTLVRRFTGHQERITDICISTDARWLLSSSMDGTLRVWDIPAASVLQVLDLGSPIISLSLSPGMEMLATSHPEQCGIFLWSNNELFEGSGSLASGARSPLQPDAAKLCLPNIGRSEDVISAIFSSDDEDGPHEILDEHQSCLQPTVSVKEESGIIKAPSNIRSPGFITLALLPRSQWESLAVLDIIKERNKPTQPVKKPKAAPFFLPTVSSESMGREPIFDTRGMDESSADVARVRKVSSDFGQEDATAFGKALVLGSKTGDFGALMSLLKGMTPSALEAEMRARELLGGDDEDRGVQDLKHLLDFVELQISKNEDFEFVQAFFRMFLTIHGDAIVSHASLSEKADRIRLILRSGWRRLDSKLTSIRCMLSFFKGKS